MTKSNEGIFAHYTWMGEVSPTKTDRKILDERVDIRVIDYKANGGGERCFDHIIVVREFCKKKKNKKAFNSFQVFVLFFYTFFYFSSFVLWESFSNILL